MAAMSVDNWLPAALRAAAIDHELTAGEPLFRHGSKTESAGEILEKVARAKQVLESQH